MHAVKDVSFELRGGTTLGIVGESGSGKSTVAAALTGLAEPSAGTASLNGEDVFAGGRALRRRISLVFQDPFSSLDPRARVGAAIGEPLRVHGLTSGRRARAARIAQLLELVGLPTDFASRYPHELSGGQRQRVQYRPRAGHRTGRTHPRRVHGLPGCVGAGEVLDLLSELQRELGLTYLFIAHDLAVVHRMCHDVLVMRAGEVVEYGPATELFTSPRHSYTRTLLAAVPPARPREGVSHDSSGRKGRVGHRCLIGSRRGGCPMVFAARGALGVRRRPRHRTRMATVFEDVPGGAYASVDISSSDACRDAVAQCVEKFGRIDA